MSNLSSDAPEGLLAGADLSLMAIVIPSLSISPGTVAHFVLQAAMTGFESR